MSGVRSLRSRLLLGALFWTIGLFVGALLIMTLIMVKYAYFPRIMHGAAYTHATLFSTITIVCMVVGFVHFRKGISPMQALRTRLGGVREGRERRVEGRYPSEVQPLVDDLNALLEHRERTVARAIARAGDLAHGLKTPLAVLAQEAERARAAGQREVADAIRQQVDRMRRQIDYHLAQARAAASGAAPGASCAVVASSEALARTLRRLYADRPLAIDQNVPPGHAVRCQREDLDEMLGNLLDNACKWSRSRVSIESAQVDGRIVVTVDDDGPGIPAGMREAVLQRGVRADEAAPGTGLGLAIVRDLAELYGGSIALGDSPLGGLRVQLNLPALL